VLAVVDDFAGSGMKVRRGASTEVAAPLEDCDAETGIGQRAGRREPCNTSANDGDSVLLA